MPEKGGFLSTGTPGPPGPAGDHAVLLNLQGGAPGEYYHLDQDTEGGVFLAGWDDLVILATVVNPAGIVGPAVYNATESTLDFQNGSSERCDFSYQMPHRWKEGSEVHFHIHVFHSTAGAGNTRWAIQYRVCPLNGAKPVWIVEPPFLLAAPGSTNHVILTIKHVDMTGILISSLVQFQVVRTGGHGDDSYAGDVQMLSADLHYQSDVMTGSANEFAK